MRLRPAAIIVAEFDVAMTRVFGTNDFVAGRDARPLSGLADVSVERTLRPPPGGDATGAGMFGEHRVVVGSDADRLAMTSGLRT